MLARVFVGVESECPVKEVSFEKIPLTQLFPGGCMDNDNEKLMLIGEITLLRIANLFKSRGLPAAILGNNDDLANLSVAELREVEDRLLAVTRAQGGLSLGIF